MQKTLFVNLYGAEGVGKSTLAKAVSSRLAQIGVENELITEWVKPCFWREDWVTIADQFHIVANQLHGYHVLDGKVAVAVSESPPLLGPILYARKNGDNPYWLDSVEHEVNRYWNLDFVLQRNLKIPYSDKARENGLDVSIQNEAILGSALYDLGRNYQNILVSSAAVDIIVEEVMNRVRPEVCKTRRWRRLKLVRKLSLWLESWIGE